MMIIMMMPAREEQRLELTLPKAKELQQYAEAGVAPTMTCQLLIFQGPIENMENIFTALHAVPPGCLEGRIAVWLW